MSENKTGIATNPKMAEAMLEAVDEFPPKSSGTMYGDEAVRIEYARSLEPDQIGYGSVPGPEPKLLMNKLGERLAFERSGVRIYEMLISKLEAFGSFEGGPSRADLELILNEEFRHASMLVDVIVGLEGDPTAMTPAADLVGVIGGGIIQVLADARTTLLQGLEAILVAELADNAAWSSLAEMAREADLDEQAEAFEKAEKTEAEHLAKVKNWIEVGQRLEP